MILQTLFPIAALAVFLVLFWGLINMARGKSPQSAQKLMRWRVGLQALAIALLLVGTYAAST